MSPAKLSTSRRVPRLTSRVVSTPPVPMRRVKRNALTAVVILLRSPSSRRSSSPLRPGDLRRLSQETHFLHHHLSQVLAEVEARGVGGDRSARLGDGSIDDLEIL